MPDRLGRIFNQRIRCNSIHPGLIRTRMLDNIYAQFGRDQGMTAEDAQNASAKHVPLHTIGEPDDIAYMILYLASDESKYVTGSEFMVDGGWHLVDAE